MTDPGTPRPWRRSDGTGRPALARFAVPATAAAAPAGDALAQQVPAIPSVLRRFLEPRAAAPPGEQCEFCTEPLTDEHAHVVDVESRALKCACRSCWFLFAPEGAAGGRYRAVPERYLHDPEWRVDETLWDELQIPVGTAFFFVHSGRDEAVAFYPSPAGATESLLPLDAWANIVLIDPVLASLEPDVEALLVHRSRDRLGCFVVPIDACYELVGLIRRNWRGFDGGTDATAAIGRFFERLVARCRRPAAATASRR